VIDLDHNATTRPSAAVTDAVVRGLREVWHNPSSVHRAGQAARAAVELARRSAANLIGALPREIVFTSGGTEAIHLAVRGTLESQPASDYPPTLITTRTEHSAVRELADELVRTGRARVVWAEIDRNGVVDVAAFESACAAGGVWLACVQWANNETGVVQPVAALSAAARKHGGLFLCDATQWVGKMPVETLDPFDLLVFAPHKFHGPKGVGVFWSRRGVRFRPSVAGSQELGRRGGTENVPGIMGAGVACDETAAWLADGAQRRELAGLRDRLEQAILAGVPGTSVNGGRSGGERLWNTTNIGFPKLEAEALLLALSERGVNASAGAACSSGSLDPSPVLLAMGVPPEIAHGSIRLSLSRHSTAEEIDRASTIIIEAANRLYVSMRGLG
jgi:cysteine desulfurase